MVGLLREEGRGFGLIVIIVVVDEERTRQGGDRKCPRPSPYTLSFSSPHSISSAPGRRESRSRSTQLEQVFTKRTADDDSNNEAEDTNMNSNDDAPPARCQPLSTSQC